MNEINGMTKRKVLTIALGIAIVEIALRLAVVAAIVAVVKFVWVSL